MGGGTAGMMTVLGGEGVVGGEGEGVVGIGEEIAWEDNPTLGREELGMVGGKQVGGVGVVLAEVGDVEKRTDPGPRAEEDL